MKIPSCFYGFKKKVRSECAKVARMLLRGMPLAEAVANYELIDTEKVPEAWIVTANMPAFFDNELRFYMTPIADVLFNKFMDDYWKEVEGKRVFKPVSERKYSKEFKESIFNELIGYEWSILTICEFSRWVEADTIRAQDYRHRWQPYLRKMCQFWDILNGEGERYLTGIVDTRLWAGVSGALRYVLANMGVPEEEAVTPCNPANLQGFCEKYNLLTMDVINNPKILAIKPLVD